MRKEPIESLLVEYGFKDFRWVAPEAIAVRQWVRFLCVESCPSYGKKAVCPPHVPAIEECERFFSEYHAAILIRFEMKAHHRDDDPEVFQDIDRRLIELEKRLFFEGHPKVIVLPATICYRCEECAGRKDLCRHKESARPTPEALGVDLFETVKSVGYPLKVIKDLDETMNRYALLMVD